MPRRNDDGFTIIGLLVVVAVINIGLAVASTSWITIDKRAREAELIWRGQQYVRALRCHQQATGALPEELEELLDSDCARALYPDPMTADGEWRVIRQGDEDLGTGFSDTGTADVALDAIDRELRGPQAFAEPFEPGRTAGRGGSARSRFDRLRSRVGGPRAQLGTASRIVGVASSSSRQSLRVYEGETTYDAWLFVIR